MNTSRPAGSIRRPAGFPPRPSTCPGRSVEVQTRVVQHTSQRTHWPAFSPPAPPGVRPARAAAGTTVRTPQRGSGRPQTASARAHKADWRLAGTIIRPNPRFQGCRAALAGVLGRAARPRRVFSGAREVFPGAREASAPMREVFPGAQNVSAPRSGASEGARMAFAGARKSSAPPCGTAAGAQRTFARSSGSAPPGRRGPPPSRPAPTLPRGGPAGFNRPLRHRKSPPRGA